MGRLPATFAGRTITEREPYNMPGEISLAASTSSQYPDATFQNNVSKPFECHRVIPRVVALDSSNIPVSPQPDQELLMELVKLTMVDLVLDYKITKSATRINTMVKGSSERTWEWADPHYLPTSNSIQVTVDVDAFPASGAEPFSGLSIAKLRVELNFEGYLITIAPPSGNRGD